MNFQKQNFKNKGKGKRQEKDKRENSEEKKEQKNILDYFIFGEEDDDVNISVNSEIFKSEKSEPKDKNENTNKIKYNVQSFITSNFRPDLYSPLGIIGGNKYNLIHNNSTKKIENEEIEAEEKEEENEVEEEEKGENEEENNINNNINIKKELDKSKLLKLGRYFILDDDITVKCHNCGQIGHVKDYCPYNDIKFCHRCLSDTHNDKDCKNKKCFRCNKSGHNKNECPYKDNDILICFNCLNSGHRKNECLINPVKIDSKFIKNNGLSCFHCGSNNHLICPISERNNIELKEEKINFDDEEEEIESSISKEMSSETPMEEEEEGEIFPENNNKKKKKKKQKKKKKKKQIFDDIKNEDIKFTIFCGYCGERHRNENCPLKDEQKFVNEFDTIRKNICKKILERRQKEKEEEQKMNNLMNMNNLNKKRKREEGNKSRDKKNNNYTNFLNFNNMKQYLPLNEDEDEDEDNFNANKNRKKSNRKK